MDGGSRVFYRARYPGFRGWPPRSGVRPHRGSRALSSGGPPPCRLVRQLHDEIGRDLPVPILQTFLGKAPLPREGDIGYSDLLGIIGENLIAALSPVDDSKLMS